MICNACAKNEIEQHTGENGFSARFLGERTKALTGLNEWNAIDGG